MKITRQRLKEIILEEALALLSEKKRPQKGPGNPYRDKETGHFSDTASAGSWSHGGEQRKWPSDTDASDCGRKDRYRCHDRSLKYEENGLLTPPRDENERQRRSRLFDGYDDLKKLTRGIVSEAFEEMLAEQDGDRLCFSREQLQKYKNRIWRQFLSGVEAYERASNPKKE